TRFLAGTDAFSSGAESRDTSGSLVLSEITSSKGLISDCAVASLSIGAEVGSSSMSTIATPTSISLSIPSS
mgnify:CR=1